MTRAKHTIKIRSDAPASPARVRDLADLVQRTMVALLERPLEDDEATLVVSNLTLSAELRAYSDDAAAASKDMRSYIEVPTRIRCLEQRQRAAVVHELREGLEPFLGTNLTFTTARGRKRTGVDDTLIGALKGIEEDAAPSPVTLRGTTETVTPIFGIWRAVDGRDGFTVKLRVDGEVVEVPLAAGTEQAALAAFGSRSEVRAEVLATWRSANGKDYRLQPSKSEVLSLEVLEESPLSGSELIETFGAAFAKSAEAGAKMAYEERGIDWRRLQ